MTHITAKGASSAWTLVSKEILIRGEKLGSILEIQNLVVDITPSEADLSFDSSFRQIFGNDRIDYASKYTFNKPEKMNGEFVYTPIISGWKNTYFGRMVSFRGELNQLEVVLKTLRKGYNSKKCEIIIYDPLTDAKNLYKQPCLLAIDIKPRNRILTLTAFFRSQRISKSGYADYTALLNLGEFLASESEMVLHNVCCVSASCHITSENAEKKKTIKLLEVV